ncbi:hypothetical protein [Streptomyces sp. NPDC046939]|uniref:hypothetical protein n=1 Tax=Streptomyces sp. NPDC046939 TaxID=3155376 RepID=UPI0033E29857
MTNANLTPSVLARIRDEALAWGRAHGDAQPDRIRVVATTRDAATRLLQPGGVRSVPDPCYFVVLEGRFQQPGMPEETQPAGIWAAFFMQPERLRADVFTIRPRGYVPHRPIEDLGNVHVLVTSKRPD